MPDKQTPTAPGQIFGQAPWHADAAVAVRHANAVWRYSELASRASHRAGQLTDRGVAPGHLVAVPVRPALDFLVMQHALARCAAALLPFGPQAAPEPLRELLALTGAEWRWYPGDGGHGRLRRVEAALHPSGGTAPALAVVLQTSGTGGPPKAVMLTGGNVLASARLTNSHLGLQPGDAWLCCLPRTHIGGLSIAYRCALAGAAMLLHDGFDPVAVIEDLRRLHGTHLSLVPPMLDRLLALEDAPPPGLRVCLVGGQALSRELAERALAAGWPLHLTYGSTETASQVATSQRLRSAPPTGLIGPALPGVTLRAADCRAAPSVLEIAGDVVMAGYANPTREGGLGLDHGWFRTSDLACLTADAQLQLMGRADEAFVVAGQQVFPSRIEAILAAAPGLSEVVVSGRPDPVWGCRIIAVYTGSIEEEALAYWCRQHLPGHDRPREFRRFEELPRTDSGKHDRNAILAGLLVEAGTEGGAS